MTKRLVDHVHGTAHNQCIHPDCKAAAKRYKKQWAVQDNRGQRGTIDARPAAMHVASLKGKDWSSGAIAAEAGLCVDVVSRLLAGQPTIKPRTAAAILAIDPKILPSTARRGQVETTVPILGTRRRLRALQYMGWSSQALADHCGKHPKYIENLRKRSGLRVFRSTHDWVAVMYRELSHKRGPSVIAARMARQYGYQGPADWDDIDHDPEPEREEDAA